MTKEESITLTYFLSSMGHRIKSFADAPVTKKGQKNNALTHHYSFIYHTISMFL